MQTRRSERATRSSTRGIQKKRQPNRTNAPSVTKPPSRKRTTNKKSLPAALQEYHKQQELDPNASSSLLKRPREIFNFIASYLPPESLVCLSLTCKLALQYIGSSCWNSPEIKKHQYSNRENLMQCLIRDAPDGLTFCEYCNTLHPPLQPPRTHRETRLTKTCMSQWAIVDYFPQVRDEDQEGAYSLVHGHIQAIFEARDSNPTAIDDLSGQYKTSKHPAFDYDLASSARWIDNRLILQHTHRFRPKSRSPLKLADILALPVRICPHTSTCTSRPQASRYLPNRPANTPFLTHAIITAFPSAQRTGAPKLSTFRTPAPSEQKQMDCADAGEDVLWKCRGCPTKFAVAVEKGSSTLQITSWYCFGADLLHANKYWEWFVRREGPNLGVGKRNSEFWFPAGRSFPDFKVD